MAEVTNRPGGPDELLREFLGLGRQQDPTGQSWLPRSNTVRSQLETLLYTAYRASMQTEEKRTVRLAIGLFLDRIDFNVPIDPPLPLDDRHLVHLAPIADQGPRLLAVSPFPHRDSELHIVGLHELALDKVWTRDAHRWSTTRLQRDLNRSRIPGQDGYTATPVNVQVFGPGHIRIGVSNSGLRACPRKDKTIRLV